MREGIDHTRPGGQRGGRGESPLSDRLLCVGHATPHRDAIFDRAAKVTERCVCEGWNFGNRRHA